MDVKSWKMRNFVSGLGANTFHPDCARKEQQRDRMRNPAVQAKALGNAEQEAKQCKARPRAVRVKSQGCAGQESRLRKPRRLAMQSKTSGSAHRNNRNTHRNSFITYFYF